MYFYDMHSDLPLDPREHVRKRPKVYVGGADSRALHHLFYQVLDHMAEEAFVGKCDRISIELKDDNYIALRDNSHGLPMELYKETKFTWMEVLLQCVGSSKNEIDPTTYATIGGLQGLGLAVVNALSKNLTVDNHYKGKVWTQSYQEGKPITSVKFIGDSVPQSIHHGTYICFQPDPIIFQDETFQLEPILKRAQQVAMLTSGLTVEVSDLRLGAETQYVFSSVGGLEAWVEEHNNSYLVFHHPVRFQEKMTVTGRDGKQISLHLEVVFQFSDRKDAVLDAYVNTVNVSEGVHIEAVKTAILNFINEYPKFDLAAKPIYSWNDIAQHMVVIISIRYGNPEFISPTKMHLVNAEIYKPIQDWMMSSLAKLNQEPYVEGFIRYLEKIE